MARDSIDDWLKFVFKAIETDPVQIDIEFDGPPGPLLSPDEIKAEQISLEQWQDPDAFKAASDALLAPYIYNNRSDLFFNPKLKFLHNAFVLARFACRHGVDKVRLEQCSKEWPDGFVQIAGEEHKIEVTSTHGGRPLGKELREIKGPTVDPGEQWVARGDSIPKFLDEEELQRRLIPLTPGLRNMVTCGAPWHKNK